MSNPLPHSRAVAVYTDGPNAGQLTPQFYTALSQALASQNSAIAQIQDAIPTDGSSLTDLANEVSEATASAADAMAALDSITDDNSLSPAEKPTVQRLYSVITTEQAGIDAQAAQFLGASSAEQVSYDGAITALAAYLNTLNTPYAWTDKSGSTNIDGTTFDNNFNTVYTTRQTLLNAIYNAAKDLADGAQDTANLSATGGFVSETVDNATFSMSLDSKGNIPGWAPFQGTNANLSYLVSAHFNNANILWITGAAVGAQSTRQYACKPGDFVSLVADMFSNDSSGAANLELRFYNASGNYISASGGSIFTSATATWQTPNSKSTAPANAAYFRILLYNAAVTTQQVGFNNIRLSVNDVRVQGSAIQIGGQGNLYPQTWGGVGSVLSNSPITYSVDSSTPAIVTFTVAAVTNQGGDVNPAYNASSGSVSQARSTTVTYYLYYLDPQNQGGSKTLHITTNISDLAQLGAANLGSASVTVAASGGGTGGGGGGGGWCVCADMLVDEDTQASEAKPGHVFDCCDWPLHGERTFKRRLLSVDHHDTECVRITTDGGAVLDCGVTTPFDLLKPEGGVKRAPDMLGEKVLTDHGIETVSSVEPIGVRPVCFFHFGGISYAAGVDPTHRIYSHNSGFSGKP